MTQEQKPIQQSFLFKILRPVIRMALRNGVFYKEFCDVAKQLFVDIATEDFGIKGRPTNISRVALLTGIDRKEVKRIRDLLENENAADKISQKRDRITRVISGWYQDIDYLDEKGNPVTLNVQGDNNSFSQLCKKYAGDIPEGALLKELERSGVVQKEKIKLDNSLIELVRIVKREFIPVETDPDAILRASEVMNDLGKTLFNNLYETEGFKKGKLFERRASNSNVDPDKYNEFRELVNQKGQSFLEEIDQWLTDNELPEKEVPEKKGIRLGVSAFTFGNAGTSGKKSSKKNSKVKP